MSGYMDQYEMLELIGRGSFGQIRKVRRKTDGLILVRKEIAYHRMTDKERIQLTSECGILSQVKHPNIVQYFHRDHIKADSTLHLYMEYCGNGDLSKTIRDCRNDGKLLPEAMVWSYFTQIVLALYRCHNGVNPPEVGNIWSPNSRSLATMDKGAMKILHRDLKPENIFLGQDNDVKLGDFGLSKMLAPEQHLANTYVGTPYYMSPEIVSDLAYTHKSDIWSLGCIIYELCQLSPPFNAKTQWSLIEKIKTGHRMPIPKQYSAELRNVIDKCLKVDPRQRPDTGELLGMDIFRMLRKERELVLLRRELRGLEERLKVGEEELRRKEMLLLAQAEEMRKDYDMRTIRLHNEIDASLRQKWEVLAQKEIRRHVEIEVEVQLQSQLSIRLESALENKIKQLDLVPRRESSLGSSGGSSGMSSTFSNNSPPPLSYFPHRVVPDSPADITMGSPSVAGTPGIRRHIIMSEDPPRFHPTEHFHNQHLQEQHPPSAPSGSSSQLPITPCRSNFPSNQILTEMANADLSHQQAEDPCPTQGFKRLISANNNGSPTRVPNTRRPFVRAGTTGLLNYGAIERRAGFGLSTGGEHNRDDSVTAADTPTSSNSSFSSQPKSRKRIHKEQMGRAAIWDRESEDAPSPFRKSICMGLGRE